MPTASMNYYHKCRECGVMFDGFKNQHTCWTCIKKWILRTYYEPHP